MAKGRVDSAIEVYGIAVVPFWRSAAAFCAFV